MSDTPRTDGAVDDCVHYQSLCDMVEAEFARQLERELAASAAEIESLRDRIDELEATTIHSCGPTCKRPACMMRRENEAMHKAIKEAHDAFNRLLLQDDPETGGIDTSPNATCPTCTSGTTPAKLDKGLCAYHAAHATLDKLKPFLK